MRHLLFFIPLMCSTLLRAQYVHDKDLSWYVVEECIHPDSTLPVYAKVELDPVITSCTRGEFHSVVLRMISNLRISEGWSGNLKIKVWFIPGRAVCVRKIGLDDDTEFTTDQLKTVSATFNQIDAFQPGRQRGIAQICEGVVMLRVSAGKLDGMRLGNFTFAR